MAKGLTAEEQLKKDYEEAQKRKNATGGRFWKPEEGDNILRILPEWKAGENFYRKVAVHYGVAQENEKLGIYCPKENADGECPVCAIAQKLYEKGDRDSLKKAGEYKPKWTYISNILLFSTPSGDGEGEVKVFSYGVTIFTGIVDIMMGKWGKIHDAVKGRNICIKRTGSKKDDTDYNVLPEPDTGPIDKKILQQIHNLDDGEGVVEVFTGEEMEQLMEGETLDDIRGKRDDGGKGKKGDKGAGVKKDAAKEPEAAAGRPPVDKKLLKRIISASVDEDIDLEKEDPEELLAEFKEKIADAKVKSLEDDTKALLEELGADVSGKTVSWPEPAGAAADESEAQGADDDDDIKAQMEKLRKQREAKGKGKK